MIRGHDRLIIVCGMAHSGTTILTHVLKEHPSVFCFVNGSESWLLENTILPNKQNESLQRILQTIPNNKRILLKRPWVLCCGLTDWLLQDLPNAKYLYCYREFSDISMSWSKPTSLIDDHLRNSKENQEIHYRLCLEQTQEFKNKVPYFKQIHHLDFVKDPTGVMSDICKWAALPSFRFNVSHVSLDKDIKNIIKFEHT